MQQQPDSPRPAREPAATTPAPCAPHLTSPPRPRRRSSWRSTTTPSRGSSPWPTGSSISKSPCVPPAAPRQPTAEAPETLRPSRLTLPRPPAPPQAELVCGPLLSKWGDFFLTDDTLSVRSATPVASPPSSPPSRPRRARPALTAPRSHARTRPHAPQHHDGVSLYATNMLHGVRQIVTVASFRLLEAKASGWREGEAPMPPSCLLVRFRVFRGGSSLRPLSAWESALSAPAASLHPTPTAGGGPPRLWLRAGGAAAAGARRKRPLHGGARALAAPAPIAPHAPGRPSTPRRDSRPHPPPPSFPRPSGSRARRLPLLLRHEGQGRGPPRAPQLGAREPGESGVGGPAPDGLRGPAGAAVGDAPAAGAGAAVQAGAGPRHAHAVPRGERGSPCRRHHRLSAIISRRRAGASSREGPEP